jgi:alpha-mannosidase
LPPRLSLWSVSAENVVVSAVRATPEGIVLRVYEAEGRVARDVTLRSFFGMAGAVETNLIEKEARPIDVGPDGKSLSFDIGAFEIKTFRVIPAAT